MPRSDRAALPRAPPPAAAITAVRNVHKVFVLNGGEGNGFLGTYPYGEQTCFNEFYTALARTGHFQLVQDPGDADLIVTIQGVQNYEFVTDLRKHAPSPEETIDYPAVVVLSLSERGAKKPFYVMSAVPSKAKKDPEKRLAVAEAIRSLTDQFVAMTGTTPSPVLAADLLQVTAPVPNKIVTAKRVFVRDDPERSSDSISGADWLEFFSDTLRASDRYTAVSSAQDADLVLALSYNRGLDVRVLDSVTMNQLWTVSDPKRYYPGLGNKLRRNEAAGTAAAFLSLSSTP